MAYVDVREALDILQRGELGLFSILREIYCDDRRLAQAGEALGIGAGRICIRILIRIFVRILGRLRPRRGRDIRARFLGPASRHRKGQENRRE